MLFRSSYCGSNDTEILMETCTSAQECYDGACIDIRCFNDTNCGTDSYLGRYCTDSGIYDDYRKHICNNPGTAQATCSFTDRKDYIETCTNDQICVYGECLDKDFYILGTFMDGDIDKRLVYMVPGTETFYIHIPKYAEIRNATLKVRGGVE